MHLNVDEESIMWPGRQKLKPPGVIIPTHLRVLTIAEKPFVYVRKLEKSQEACAEEEIPCPHFNETDNGKITLVCLVNTHIFFFSFKPSLRFKLFHNFS